MFSVCVTIGGCYPKCCCKNLKIFSTPQEAILAYQLRNINIQEKIKVRADQWLEKKLKANGNLHIATDWKDYAEWIVDIMSKSPEFSKLPESAPHSRPTTKFEKRGIDLGHGVWDLIYSKNC